MNILDIIICILLAGSFYKGFQRGFLATLAALLGVILGIIGAYYFSDLVASWLIDWFNWDQYITTVSAFIITFLGILFLVSLVGKIFTKIIDFAALGFLNKLLGGVFNCIKTGLIISVLLWIITAFATDSDWLKEQTKEGKVTPYISKLAPSLIPHISIDLDTLNPINETEQEAEK